MALQRSKQQIRKFRRERRRAEDTEIEDLERRILEEAPPKGWTPLAEDFGTKKAKKQKASDASASGEDSEDDEEATKAKAAADAAGNPLTVTFSKKTFSELPISRRTLEGLDAFQYRNMTDIQRAALPHALAGRDVLGAAKTGSGKTLAFIIPIIEKLYRLKWSREDGLGALVLSPTRELALQTFEVLRKVGSRHDSLSAGLVIGGKDIKLEQERIGRMNILISTPGRLLQHMDQTVDFQTNSLKILVLDEADRILDMGFKKEVDAIIENLPPSRQTLLFSATQTSSVQQLARLSLSDPEYLAVHDASATTTPKKLMQSYIELEAQQKMDTLWSFLKSHLKQKTIVFASSQKQVRYLFETFRRLRPGVALLHIHGKMNQQKRMAMYLDYVSKDAAVLFATDIAARGLDFKGIDWVIQLDAPENVDTYIHRVGRTARYHSDGHAILFLLPSEVAFLERLEKRKIPVERMKVNPAKTQSIQQSLQALLIKEPELKYLAQRALRSYLRSIHIMNDKEVFDVTKINTEELAYSYGLMQIPNLKFGSVKKVDKNAEIFKSKIETMQRRMDEAAEAKKQKKKLLKQNQKEAGSGSSGDSSDSSDEDERLGSSESEPSDASVASNNSDDDEMIVPLKKQKQRKTKLEKLMNKKNTTVLSDAFAKMRGKADDEGDDILVLKRKLTSDDSDADMDVDAAAEPVQPQLTKSKLKKMFTKIDPNKPRFGNLVEFNDSDNEEQQAEKLKAAEPFIDQAVQSIKERDTRDQVAYQEKLREKKKIKKDKKKKEEEEKRARKAEHKAKMGLGLGGGGAVLGSPDDDDDEDNGSSGSDDESSSDSSSVDTPQKKKMNNNSGDEEIRRGKRKRPDESSSESNSDDDDSDDDKANFAAKRMKLENQAKKVLSKRLGK